MLTMKHISEDDGKEWSHLIIDLGIRGFLCFCQEGEKLPCDPTADHGAARPGGLDLLAIPESSHDLCSFIRPAVDLKGITDDRAGINEVIPLALINVFSVDQNIAAHSYSLPYVRFIMIKP